jgi:hypothetical protein
MTADGYGDTPWWIMWTPDFKDEHACCSAALKAWPGGISIPEEVPAVVTVLIHKDLLEYVFDEDNRITGVRASERLRSLADEQSKKN